MHTELLNENGLPSGEVIKTTAQTSSLNDELGQVRYILSDKTGTLTCNQMLFDKLIIGDNYYSDMETTPLQDRNFDENLVRALKAGRAVPNTEVSALRCLALCHNVIFDERHQFNSSSPEELAFVKFSQNYQIEFHDFETIEGENFIILKEQGATQRYKLLAVFEFTSERKKMSVIVEKDGEIMIYTKGADDIVRKDLSNNSKPEMEKLARKLDKFAQNGYRVMLLAMKKIPRDEWNVISRDYEKAKNDPMWLDVLQKRTEKELQLIGGCSIEDKLQDKVKESIEFIRKASIKMWIITGDKGETAISVGKNAGLINSATKLYRFEEYGRVNEFDIKIERPCCVIVYGSFLGNLLNEKESDAEGYQQFTKTLMQMDSAIFCRISPKQKQEIVKIIHNYNSDIVTLAIGDGANDASMISAAHIGVGIKGREGDQAARASDYFIGEFKHLVPLLFVFGTECYQRNSNVILYNFYKNFLLVLPQFWFGFFNIFSGVSIYEPFAYQLFNVVFTFLPIFIYGVFDKQFSRAELLSTHKFYEKGLKSEYFNTRRFVQNIVVCVILSMFLTICAFVCFDLNPRDDGNFYGLWNFGNMVFFGVVVLSNLKILLISNSYSVMQYLIVLISTTSFFLVWYLIQQLNTSIYSSIVYNTFYEVVGKPEGYIFLLMILSVSLFESLLLKLQELTDCKDAIELNRKRKNSDFK